MRRSRGKLCNFKRRDSGMPGSKFFSALALSAAALVLSSPLARSEQVLSPSEQRGFTFVRVHCSHCHSIDKVSGSPLSVAPPFRRLHERYPVESLQEALAEGIITGHPSMPEFKLDPGQVNDVISYLKSLER